MDSELNAKEVAFNRIIQWLGESGFGVEERTRKKDPNAETQFEAKINLPDDRNLPSDKRLFF